MSRASVATFNAADKLQASKMEQRTKTETLAHLQQEIRRFEGFQHDPSRRGVALGIPALEEHLPHSQFPLGAIHEFDSSGNENSAATQGFVTAILSLITQGQGNILWATKSRTVFPCGLSQLGVNPDRVIFLELARDKELLWAMEEALRCPSVTAVVAEIANVDLTATRRLQLAVERSGVTGFLLRENPRALSSTACVTRWAVKPLPSVLQDGLPGVGFPRWHVELTKARNGRPGQWDIEWRSNQFHLLQQEQEKAKSPSRLFAR